MHITNISNKKINIKLDKLSFINWYSKIKKKIKANYLLTNFYTIKKNNDHNTIIIITFSYI